MIEAFSRTPMKAGWALPSYMGRIGDQGALSMMGAVAGVSALAVGQPLLAILGDAPEFFVAKAMSPLEVVLFATAVLLGPMIVGLVVWLIARVNRVLGGALLTLVLTFLVVALAANGLNRLTLDTLWVILGLGGIGVVFLLAYVMSGSVRSWVRLLWVAAPVILAWFLLITPATALVFPGDDTRARVITGIEDDYPVVLLIFDEFPVTTIMDGSGNLVSEQFPGFASLSADGVWYRNATTVADRTQKAVPAILTGRRIEDGVAPLSSDHPNTLFTALRSDYQISAVENITSMCPEAVCGRTRSTPVGLSLWRGLALDSAVVMGHVLVPAEYADVLPSIDATWEGFTGSDESVGSEWNVHDHLQGEVEERMENVDVFYEKVRQGGEPGTLVMGHHLFPHLPWVYLADGTFIGRGGYSVASTEDPTSWVDNDWLLSQVLQRHVLATQFVDGIVAETISLLKQKGTYENTLLIVVADHGLTFKPGVQRRNITEETIGSIAAIPLFVKYPRGFDDAPDPGTVSDEPVATIDIVPTILDVIGSRPPYRVDGQSMLGPITRTERVTDGPGNREVIVGLDGQKRFDVAKEIDEILPGRDPWRLLPDPSLEGIIGTSPKVTDVAGIETTLDQPGRYRNVQKSEGISPSVVMGTVNGPDAQVGDWVAVLVDGKVVTVTETFEKEEGGIGFYSLVEPSAFQDGDNAVAGVVVSREGRARR